MGVEDGDFAGLQVGFGFVKQCVWGMLCGVVDEVLSTGKCRTAEGWIGGLISF